METPARPQRGVCLGVQGMGDVVCSDVCVIAMSAPAVA